MTETQAREYAEKLSVIWKAACRRNDEFWELQPSNETLLIALPNEVVWLCRGDRRALLSCSYSTGYIDEDWECLTPELCGEWLDIFRRNCFLCGFKIEHTAHERLEWTLWHRDQLELNGMASNSSHSVSSPSPSSLEFLS